MTSRRQELLALDQGLADELHRLLSHFGKQDVPVFVDEEIRNLDPPREEVPNLSDRRRSRPCAAIPCWGDLDPSRVAARSQVHLGAPPEALPGVMFVGQAEPQPTPEQRVMRFQRMLDSGEVKSRAALAGERGVGRNAEN